ncbi:MAG: glucose/arabinose dehydrogenase [Verrucomicrobiales bacterium]
MVGIRGNEYDRAEMINEKKSVGRKVWMMSATIALLFAGLDCSLGQQRVLLDTVAEKGLSHLPTAICFSEAVPDRPDEESMFIATQPGKIFAKVPGAARANVILDLSGIVSYGGESGVLGLALAPDFLVSRHFYVCYSTSDALNVSKFTLMPEGKEATLASELEVISIPPLGGYSGIHKGGQIAFGPDQHLFIAVGDGGRNRELREAHPSQSLTSLLGKILRLDVKSRPEEGNTYTIPNDNPFLGTDGARPEIWALGLRNPW